MSDRSLIATPDGIRQAKIALKGMQLNQTSLSVRLDVTRQPISRFFNGKPVNNSLFVQICETLKLNWQEISGLAQPKTMANGIVAVAEKELKLDDLVHQVREQIKARIHEQCGNINVLTMTKPIDLGDIYTDVNILETIAGRKRLTQKELEAHCAEEEFERFGYSNLRKKEERIPGLEAVDRCRKMVVLGKPGAGKTTFLKRIATQCNGGTFHPELVPIFVPLKLFAETKGQPNLLPYIASQWTESKVKEAESKAETLLDEGCALVLLDGLDEVLKADSTRIIEEIRYFSERFHRNLYVVTCRNATHEFKLEPFTEVEIADFNDQQIAVFVTKWFEHKNPQQTEFFLHKLKDSPRIRELATNPLLLTLLCLNVEESGDFAESRAALYKGAMHVLLKSWNAKKRGIPHEEVYRQLTPDCKEDLLSQLAYQTFQQGQYVFREEIAKQHIRHYIENLPSANTDVKQINVDSEAVLKSIEGQHGLLISRAQGIYSFAHLTLQEYFTARERVGNCNPYAATDKTLQGLVQQVTDKRWREIFLLVAEMLPSADCFLQLIKRYVDELVGQDKALQQFLEWAQEKAAAANTSYKPAAIRAFYIQCPHAIFALALGIALNLDNTWSYRYYTSNGITSRDFDLDNTPDLDLDFNLYRALYYSSSLNHHLNISIDHPLCENDAWHIVETLSHVCTLNPRFCQIFQELEAQLFNLEQHLSAFKKWWDEKGKGWFEMLRNSAIEYRNIGHEWSFTSEQIVLFQQYLEINLLLIFCLKSNCNISPSVRAEIEETLLLPIAAIEQRKSQEGT